jgi:hypothetical protein
VSCRDACADQRKAIVIRIVGEFLIISGGTITTVKCTHMCHMKPSVPRKESNAPS